MQDDVEFVEDFFLYLEEYVGGEGVGGGEGGGAVGAGEGNRHGNWKVKGVGCYGRMWGGWYCDG